MSRKAIYRWARRQNTKPPNPLPPRVVLAIAAGVGLLIALKLLNVW